MSKVVGVLAQKVKAIKNAPAKFTASTVEDSRHHEAKTKRLNVVLQVNSQAKNPTLKDWVEKNSTHGKLATASFDTSAKDPSTEMKRVVEELERTAKKNFDK